MTSTLRRQALDAASLIFVLSIALGGYFLPLLGLALAGLMGAALALSLMARYGLAGRRTFCVKVCPRGRALGFALGPFSRGKPLPAWASKLGVRRLLCGLMMFCLFGGLMRVARSVSNQPALEPAGRVFWALCALSLSAGLLLGLRYRPRAWCAVCPMGTLQDTVSGSPEPPQKA